MIDMVWTWPPWLRVTWGRTMPDEANEDYMWLRIATKGNGSMGRIGMNGDLTEWKNMWQNGDLTEWENMCTAGRGRDLAAQTRSSCVRPAAAAAWCRCLRAYSKQVPHV